VALARSGDQAAFEALVRRYQPRLLSFCDHMLGAAAGRDAEDVVQESFVAAYIAMVADERAIEARPWLYRIARNRCLNQLRGSAAATIRPANGNGEIWLESQLADGGLSAADQAGRREELRHLVGDVRDLPESQRSALILHELEAMTYKQVADAMSTTVPSVKSLLVRARVSLRRTRSRALAALSPGGLVPVFHRVISSKLGGGGAAGTTGGSTAAGTTGGSTIGASGLSTGAGAVATKAATATLLAGTALTIGVHRSAPPAPQPTSNGAAAMPVEQPGPVATPVRAETSASPVAHPGERSNASSAGRPAQPSASHHSSSDAKGGPSPAAPSGGGSPAVKPDDPCGVPGRLRPPPTGVGAVVDHLCRGNAVEPGRVVRCSSMLQDARAASPPRPARSGCSCLAQDTGVSAGCPKEQGFRKRGDLRIVSLR
jgi:RNA polymerase sigma factor (sigma-70 family)